MIKSLSKKTAFLLALILVINMFVIPETAEAFEITDNTEEGSYIKAEVTGVSDKDYITITTFGGGGYKM